MTFCPLVLWLKHQNTTAICCACRYPQLLLLEKIVVSCSCEDYAREVDHLQKTTSRELARTIGSHLFLIPDDIFQLLYKLQKHHKTSAEQ